MRSFRFDSTTNFFKALLTAFVVECTLDFEEGPHCKLFVPYGPLEPEDMSVQSSVRILGKSIIKHQSNRKYEMMTS